MERKDISICDKNLCTGCAVCSLVCPVNSVTMMSDSHGFQYPNIDNDRCIKCGICEKHCHVKHNTFFNPANTEVYAVQALDNKIRKQCSSGGVVHLLAQRFFENNDIVSGAVYDEQWNVYEDICESLEDYEFRGFSRSKYVQSETRQCFKNILNKLNVGKKVLFIGTPCQVAALKTYVGTNDDNLYTVDFVCHGVPSPAVFKWYLNNIEEKYKSKIKKIDFRIKKPSWSLSSIRLLFENGKAYYGNMLEDYYCVAFVSNIISRDCCYSCKYACGVRVGDLTVCDYWGMEDKNDSIKNDELGTSITIANNKKGGVLLNLLKPYVRIEKRYFSEIKESNKQLEKPNERPVESDNFWQDFDNNKAFEKISNSYLKPLNSNLSKKERFLQKYKNTLPLKIIIKIYVLIKNILSK